MSKLYLWGYGLWLFWFLNARIIFADTSVEFKADLGRASCCIFCSCSLLQLERAWCLHTFVTSISCLGSFPNNISPSLNTILTADGHGHDLDITHNDCCCPHSLCFVFISVWRFVYMHIKWYKRRKRQQLYQHYNCSAFAVDADAAAAAPFLC